MMKITNKKVALHWYFAIYLIVATIALLDFKIGGMISLYMLYLLPIGFIGIYGNRLQAIMLSIVCGGVWILVDNSLGILSFENSFSWVEIISRLILLIFIAYIIGSYRIAYQALLQQAYRDEKTGAYNYSAFLEIGTKYLKVVSRSNEVASLAYFDMDNFKIINDSYGHSTGDKVLLQFSNIVMKHVRSSDLFARIGGDEFIVLFIGSDADQSRDNLEKIKFEFNALMANNNYPTTVSIGLIDITKDKSLEVMIMEADLMMYEAKSKGKNTINQGDGSSGSTV
ncbi:conserved membrane protein of unknown function [Petrocella atlantisensis]|uniref:GGDEF domain-containing protein n=2 Tax=Petrocella atlantisensis TaxID=2173034 RepID=A0A3P7RZQ4_9FIRM|nr:conserved membrane protein of unknown function [Petrocella atlantisensis]